MNRTYDQLLQERQLTMPRPPASMPPMHQRQPTSGNNGSNQGILFYSQLDQLSQKVVSELYNKLPNLYANIKKIDMQKNRRIVPARITQCPTLIVRMHPQPLIGEAILHFISIQQNLQQQQSAPPSMTEQNGPSGFCGNFGINYEGLLSEENNAMSSLDRMYQPLSAGQGSLDTKRSSGNGNRDMKLSDGMIEEYMKKRDSVVPQPHMRM